MSHNPQHLPIPGRKNICAFLPHFLLPIHVRRIPQEPRNASSQLQRQRDGTKSLLCVSRHFLPSTEGRHMRAPHMWPAPWAVAACCSLSQPTRHGSPRALNRFSTVVNRFSSQPAHRYKVRQTQETQHVRCTRETHNTSHTQHTQNTSAATHTPRQPQDTQHVRCRSDARHTTRHTQHVRRR